MSQVTGIVPKVPATKFKRTKIIATVGPATNSYEAILAMIKAGVNGFRLNFSHGDYEERKSQIAWIRRASLEYGKPAAIIQDLQGPKIRLGDFEGFVSVSKNQVLELEYGKTHEANGPLPIQYDLSTKVKPGERLLLADGKIRGVVQKVKDKRLYVKLDNDGILTKRKGINLPDTDFGGDVLTKKDRQDMVFGCEQEVDYVAISFIQTADDVKHVKRLLKNLNSQAKLITKIETKAAVEHLESVVEESDAVMVARGDLATETMPESVPVIQREIIRLCLKHEKISIVATQMMVSMMEQPEPTRAEVSDVATSVIVGADCVMLSDETANGRFPIETIEYMKRIISYTQDNATIRVQFDDVHQEGIPAAISESIIVLANRIKASAIVVQTSSGQTARSMAAYRPEIPIIAITHNPMVAQQLTLLYGTKSFVRSAGDVSVTKLTKWLLSEGIFKKGDRIVSTSSRYPGRVGATDTIKVRVLE